MDCEHERGEGPAHTVPYYSTLTSPPGGVLHSIRLLEYVLARLYATTGRIGLGLHRTTRAALPSIGSSRDSTEHLMGASSGPDLVRPGRLTCYAIGTTASADPPGIFLPAHHWDRSPGKVIRHLTRRATRSFWGAGPKEILKVPPPTRCSIS